MTLLYGYWSVDLGAVDFSAVQTRTEPVVMEDTKFISKRDLILSVSGALTVGILIALTVYCLMRRNKKKLHHVESGRVSFIRQHHNRKFNLFGKEVKMRTINRVKCDLFFIWFVNRSEMASHREPLLFFGYHTSNLT